MSFTLFKLLNEINNEINKARNLHDGNLHLPMRKKSP